VGNPAFPPLRIVKSASSEFAGILKRKAWVMSCESEGADQSRTSSQTHCRKTVVLVRGTKVANVDASIVGRDDHGPNSAM
jgi:hypothetical protein